MMERKMGWRFGILMFILGTVGTAAIAAPPVEEDDPITAGPAVQTSPTVKTSAKPRSFLFFFPRKTAAPELDRKSADENAVVPQRSSASAPGRVSVHSDKAAQPKPFFSNRKPAAAIDTHIEWQTDLKQAHRLSITSKKPLLLVFGASWCQSCLKMEREVLHRPEIAGQVMSGFIPVHVDADRNPQLIELLEVEFVPAIIVLNQDLEVLRRLDGYQSAGKLASALASDSANRKLQPVNAEE